MPSVLLVGCGKMGGAMLRRWVGLKGYSFTVADPNVEEVPDGVPIARSAAEIVGQFFDIIVIAVKPQMVAETMPHYTACLANKGVYMSIAAGLSIASLEKVLNHNSIVRTMPNLPASIGKGVIGYYAPTGVSRELIATIKPLLEATGTALAMDNEDQIDRLTALAGSGPGYIFELMRNFVSAAEALGFEPDSARRIVTHTFEGSVALAKTETNISLETMRDNVTSKKGTTEAGLQALRKDNVAQKLIADTLNAAYERAKQLR